MSKRGKLTVGVNARRTSAGWLATIDHPSGRVAAMGETEEAAVAAAGREFQQVLEAQGVKGPELRAMVKLRRRELN